MTDTIEDIQERTEQALAKGTFNLRSALEGRSYPTAKVIVYTDIQNIHRLAKVNDRLSVLARAGDKTDETAKREAQAEQFKAKVLESALTFHLRGISPMEIEKISKYTEKYAKNVNKDVEDTEIRDYHLRSLLAAHIVRVENAQGEVDEHRYTQEEIEEVEGILPSEQFSLLIRELTNLSFETAYFTQTVDAGFLPTS